MSIIKIAQEKASLQSSKQRRNQKIERAFSKRTFEIVGISTKGDRQLDKSSKVSAEKVFS